MLLGNPTKAKEVLKWNPTQTPFVKLVQEMVDADVELYARGRKQNACVGCSAQPGRYRLVMVEAALAVLTSTSDRDLNLSPSMFRLFRVANEWEYQQRSACSFSASPTFHVREWSILAMLHPRYT